MLPRVKVAFASGSDDLIPTLLEKMSAIYPELPLYVVSEFAPTTGTWIRWYPAKELEDNAGRIDAALEGKQVVLAGIILQPRMPYWNMRWAAARRWPRQLMVFNENLDHFMLRPGQLPVMLRHLAWRTRNFIRWETRPGGTFYTLLWRLFHPWAFRRPIAFRLALWSERLARLVRRPGEVLTPSIDLPDGISVVIPSRNGRELLARLFASFEGQWPQQVIVSDNGSTDGTTAWLKSEFPHVGIVESPRPLSFAAAVNGGIAAVNYRRTCLLNNDMVLEPGFFAALAAPFDDQPNLFAATAQIFFPAGARREETGKAMYHDAIGGRFPISCDLPLEGEDGTWVLYGSGGCTLYDTARLRALGGIGEQFTPAYVEDLDIGWRAWRQSWPSVFAGKARLLHLHRSTTSKYYTEAELECALERNYVRFAAASGSARLWREAMQRLNELAARQEPVRSAEKALFRAWLEPWRQPFAAPGSDAPLDLCNGDVAVFPGRASGNKPRIAIAAPYLPFPLSHGGAVRMFNLMREAAKEYSQILIVFADELIPPAPELLEICTEIILVRRAGTHLLPTSPRPDVVEEHDTLTFRAALQATLSKWRPHIVQLEFTQMGLYAPDCRPARVLLVEHDITLDLYGQLLANREDYDTRRQYEKWVAFEHSIWQQVDGVVVMSEKDRATLGASRATVIGNGVDLARFSPGGEPHEPRRLLFIGSFAHLPNVMALEWFLREAWPLLRDVTLHVIAGQKHEFHLDRYADRVKLDLNRKGIELEGFVTDVRDAYRRAAVVIAPLVASAGTNIKIMEAMAMGKAIVSTPAGINGLDLNAGRDVIVAEDGASMASEIALLLDQPQRRIELESQARSTAESRYSWESIARIQSGLYRTLLQKDTLH